MANHTPLKIFLLDDNPFCTALCLRQLENMGHTDITCFTEDNACLNSLPQQPDVVFLDYSIGTVSGIDILKKIKRVNPDIYVVFLSAHEGTEIAASALKNGAFDCIIKGQDENEKIKKTLLKIQQIQNMLSDNKSAFLKRFSSMI